MIIHCQLSESNIDDNTTNSKVKENYILHDNIVSIALQMEYIEI